MPEKQQGNATQQGGGTNGGGNQSDQSSSGTGAQGTGDSTSQNQGGDKQGDQGTGGTQDKGTETQTGDQGAGGKDTSKSGSDTTVKTGAADGTKSGDKTDDKPAVGIWPADWRQQLAGDDKAFLAQLERYAAPGDLAKKIREQDKLISSGQIKQPLAKDATPEQVAAWRKENNIPEAPEKYDLSLPKGLVIGEADKPIVDNMVKAMHGGNLTQDQVSGVLAAYYEQEKQFTANQEKEAAENKQRNEDKLRGEWGGEYRGEVNRIENLLSTFSVEAQQAIQFGHDNKGMPLLDNTAFLKDLAVMSRALNPVTTLVPSGGGNQMDSVQGEIAMIEKRMTDDRDGYFKDNKMQERYRQLLEWQDKNQKKTA